MELILYRFLYAGHGTFGVFHLPDGKQLFTVERPWVYNTPYISCIPTGRYTCKPRWYNKGDYAAIEVTDVTGRTYILFHVGNFVHNSLGCILVNSKLVEEDGKLRGVSSRKAFNRFMDVYAEGFTLEIVNAVPGAIAQTNTG